MNITGLKKIEQSFSNRHIKQKVFSCQTLDNNEVIDMETGLQFPSIEAFKVHNKITGNDMVISLVLVTQENKHLHIKAK